MRAQGAIMVAKQVTWRYVPGKGRQSPGAYRMMPLKNPLQLLFAPLKSSLFQQYRQVLHHRGKARKRSFRWTPTFRRRRGHAFRDLVYLCSAPRAEPESDVG
jgi:hypothetical protein